MTVWAPVLPNSTTWAPVLPDGSTVWAPVIVAIPLNVTLPVVTGAGEVFDALTVSNGTWEQSPSSYAYAWYRNGVLIAGETEATYYPPTAGSYKARVTATNVKGSATAESAAVTVTASGATLLSRLVGIASVVSSYDARDTSSLSATSVGAPITSVADKVAAGDQGYAAYVAAQTDLSTASGLPTTLIRDADTSQTLTIFANLVAGKRYALTWAGSHNSGFGGFRLANGADPTKYAPSISTQSGPGTYYFRAMVSGALVMSGDAPGWSCTVDSVSLREIGGNLLLQSTSASRPTLGGYPSVNFDGVNDVLNAYVETGIGTSCAIYYFDTSDETHHWLTGQTLSAGLNAMPSADWGRLAIFSATPDARDQAITEAWGADVYVPPLPDGYLALDAEFEDGALVSLQGAVRDPLGLVDILSSATDNGDGTYSLSGVDIPEFYPRAACTVMIEYTALDVTAQGIPLQWTGTGANEFVFFFNTADAAARKMYYRLNQSAGYATPAFKHPNDGAAIACLGRSRVILALEEGEAPHAIANNFIDTVEAIQGVAPVIGSPSKLTFGKNGRASAPTPNPLTNATLHRVQIWVDAGDADFLDEKVIAETAHSPVHFLGDSFLNVGKLREEVMKRSAPGGYVPYSQDGVGGVGLTAHALRYASPYTKWHSANLCIVEGGPDDDGPTSVAALEDILSHGAPDWVFVESSPQEYLPGSADRIAYEAKMDAIRTFAGDHWLPTLALITNTDPEAGEVYHDGSVEDLADCANGIWPRSLRSDVIHPNNTPNSAGWSGNMALGKIIYDALVLRGWLP